MEPGEFRWVEGVLGVFVELGSSGVGEVAVEGEG
jgi:hypothetical protein